MSALVSSPSLLEMGGLMGFPETITDASGGTRRSWW
jgi:hypothetical protein